MGIGIVIVTRVSNPKKERHCACAAHAKIRYFYQSMTRLHLHSAGQGGSLGLLHRRASKPWRHRRHIESTHRSVQILVSPGCSFFYTLLFPSKSTCTVYLGWHLFVFIFLTLDCVISSNIGHFRVQKVVQTDDNGLTNERTDAHQKLEASCTKALKGNNYYSVHTLWNNFKKSITYFLQKK